MYAFNTQPFNRTEASTFGTVGLAGFDDRDAQYLVGFNTAAEVSPGLQPEQYHVWSVRLHLTVSQGDLFVYDPTHDALETYLGPVPGEPNGLPPEPVADGDAGRPVELFMVRYRRNFNATDTDGQGPVRGFEQNSSYGAPLIQPAQGGVDPGSGAEGGRNAHAGVMRNGALVDASRNVRELFEAPPIAVGATESALPGQPVPAGAEFTFDVQLSDADTFAYIRSALSQGRLNLMASSLHEVEQQVLTSPIFYTSFDVLGAAPRLEIRACGSGAGAADWNCADGVDSQDFFDFLDEYFSGTADFNGVDGTDSQDYFDFLEAFFSA